MAINIGNNADGDVTYQNPPVNRVLFPNITYETKPEEIQTAINVWLNNHPEATTTVQDGSILPVKLDSSNSATDGYVLSYNATTGKFEWYDINSDITELKQDLSDNFGLKKVNSFTQGRYINVNVNVGSVVDLTMKGNDTYACAVFDCNPSDKIMINGVGGAGNARLWAFIDSENKLLSKAAASVSADALVVTAPANTAKCVINSEKAQLGNCYITPDWFGTTNAIISNAYDKMSISISSGDDLNNYTTPGNFYVSSATIANSLINKASNLGGRLIVITLNSIYNIFQIYIATDGHIFTREKDNSGWSVWTESGEQMLSFETATSIPSGADLNDYTTPGNYYVNSTTIANSLINKASRLGGRLLVMTLNSAINIFHIYVATNGAVFTREKDNNGWSGWVGNDGLKLTVESSVSVSSGDNLNDYTTPGNYYVPTTAIANSLTNKPKRLGGRLVVMTLNSIYNIFQIYIATDGTVFTREKDNSGWSDWVNRTESAKYSAKGAYNAIQAIIPNVPYSLAFANAFTPLEFANYLGNSQNAHPKVLYFENSFGGHNFWMAYTPYPDSNDLYENPCIAYSDDGYSWTNIPGNPLDDPEGDGYDSDAHIVYRDDTGELECWYRHYDRTTLRKTIYRQVSVDGITWSQKELVQTIDDPEDCASPAIIWDGTYYYIWGVSGVTVHCWKAPGNDVTNWTLVHAYGLSFSDGGVSVNPWHLDVIMDGDTYVWLVMCRNGRDPDTSVWSLFITTSSDNTNYSAPIKVVGGADNWDKYMYRSSIVKVGNVYRIYYSACNTSNKTSIYNNAKWGMGITESDDLDSGYIGKYV